MMIILNNHNDGMARTGGGYELRNIDNDNNYNDVIMWLLLHGKNGLWIK